MMDHKDHALHAVLRREREESSGEVARLRAELARAEGERDEARADREEQTLRHWIIVQRPGLAPYVNVPPQKDEGVTAMLREIQALYPDAESLVARHVYGNDLWIESGAEWLSIRDPQHGGEDGSE